MFAGEADAGRKAGEIAMWLGNTNMHKTHGRPIGADQAEGQGLIVTHLEDDEQLQDCVLSVFHAVNVTFQASNCVKAIENQHGMGQFINVDVQPK
jgi:hypothetical protein